MSESMAAGAIGGLVAWLLSFLVSPWIAGHRADLRAAEVDDTYWRRALQIGLVILAAALIGALYWLSWGLAAVVNVTWWVRGLVFAALCWAALTLPALLALRIRTSVDRNDLATTIVEWLLTILGAGLACAWITARVL